MALVSLLLIAAALALISCLSYYDTVEEFAMYFLMASGLVMMGSLAFPLFGAYHWLRHGEWASLTIQEVLDNQLMVTSAAWAETGWTGIDKLSAMYLQSNAGWTVFLLGAVMAYTSGYAHERGEADRRQTAKEAEELGQ